MRPIIPSLALILAASLTPLSAADSFDETFSAAAESTPIKSLPGWTVHAGPGQATVELASGFTGLGGRITGNEQLRLTIPGDQAPDLNEGSAEFRIKVRLMPENDGYTQSQILVGQDDGVHGVIVRFNGGTKDGPADNFIQLSQDGESWGKATYEDRPDSAWKRETWYEIIVTIASATEARVTVKEADSNTALVEDHQAGIVGTSGKFTRVNTIIVGNGGTARAFDFDDISLQAK